MCTAISLEFKKRIQAENYEFQTFYAGGGTPSLLPPEFWSRLIGIIKSPSLKEVTIEINPSALDAIDYSSLRIAGFNRISVGVQSFKNEHLTLLGRRHTADEAKESLTLISKTGFKNISIDLMYGLPRQTIKDQKSDIQEVIRFRPQHISAYDLTLEPDTPMGDKGEKASESQCVDMYYQLDDMLKAEGYMHYEVSSYALSEEYRSLHNRSYWNRTPYLGIGPSAHSFTGTERSWNISDILKYESSILHGNSVTESCEILTEENMAFEMLALGFRNTDGVNLNTLKQLGFQLNPTDLIKSGLVFKKENILIPSTEAMLFADHLALTAADLLERV